MLPTKPGPVPVNNSQKETSLYHPKYRPDIDGLRAIAVLSVVGYHAFPSWIPGGFVGVDIFFVISGYLISLILMNSLEEERFSYSTFYARRIKRIFPALLVVLISSFSFGWYVLFAGEFSSLGKHMAAGASFIANIAFWNEAGYFDTASELKPLLHLWSLGVEEQFYIVWPIFLGVAWRRSHSILPVTSLLAVMSLTTCIVMADQFASANFYLPFSRFWELMLGGILAYTALHLPEYRPANAIARNLLATAGLMLILGSIFLFSNGIPFPGGWALIPVLGTCLMIYSGNRTEINRLALGFRPLVYFGLISYPLYLWHWPLLAYARIIKGGPLPRDLRILLVCASILLAAATYHFLEKNLRKSAFKSKSLTLSFLMLAAFIVGLAVWSGVIKPRHQSDFVDRVIAEVYAGKNWSSAFVEIKDGGGTIHIKKGGDDVTLYIGDSHMQHFAPRIAKVIDQNTDANTAIFITGGGCPPIPNVYSEARHWCTDLIGRSEKWIANDRVKTVVIAGFWNHYFSSQEADPRRRHYYLSGEGKKHDLGKSHDGVELAMRALEIFIKELPKRTKVFLILDTPSGERFSPLAQYKGTRFTNFVADGESVKGLRTHPPLNQKHILEATRKIANNAKATVLDPTTLLCNENGCRITTKLGLPVYFDGGHLSASFVETEASFMDITLSDHD